MFDINSRQFGGYDEPVLSPDGTKLAFKSLLNQVYIKDLVTGALTPVTTVPDGQRYAFTADGSALVLASGDGSLVAGDTNGTSDVFRIGVGQTSAGLVRDSAERASSGTSGALPFTDPDLGDAHTVAVKPGAGALGTLTARITREPGAKAGAIAWDYSVDHKAVATLEQGKTKVETFTVTVDDGHGGKAEQVVTITVLGSAPSTKPTSVHSASAADTGTTQSHTSTDVTDLSSTEHTHVVDTHQGHGLTGFEL